MVCAADVRGAPANLDLRRLIVGGMVKRFRENCENAEMVAGLAKADIARGMILAREFEVPAGVVHLDGPRNSGLQQRQVEGSVAGRRVVVLANLTRTRSSVIDAARIIGSEVGTISGAMTVVGPGKGPARFRVSTLCTDAALEAEGRRQGSVLPAHLDGSPGAADPVPPLGGFDLSK